jgi:hypothetical protein
MKKALVFILLVLFAGLAVFGGKSINGPGVRDFVSYEYEIPAAFSAGIAAGAVPANGLTGAFPVICSINSIIEIVVPGPIYDMRAVPAAVIDGAVKAIKGRSAFECTMTAYSGVWKGGVPLFNGGLKARM